MLRGGEKKKISKHTCTNSIPETSDCTTTMTVKVCKCDSPSTLQKCSTPYPSLALGNNLLDADNHNLSSSFVSFLM